MQRAIIHAEGVCVGGVEGRAVSWARAGGREARAVRELSPSSVGLRPAGSVLGNTPVLQSLDFSVEFRRLLRVAPACELVASLRIGFRIQVKFT